MSTCFVAIYGIKNHLYGYVAFDGCDGYDLAYDAAQSVRRAAKECAELCCDGIVELDNGVYMHVDGKTHCTIFVDEEPPTYLYEDTRVA